MTLLEIQKKITPLLEQAGVEYAGVFGSTARGESRPDSDVDILIKFQGPATFSAYIDLDEGIRKILNCDIDLVTEGALNKFLRPLIEQDLKLIYGQRSHIS